MKNAMSWAGKFAWSISLLAASSGVGRGGDFIRVRESEETAKLQTAVFGYQREGIHVDLIGAIHLADREYYDFLNTYFENYGVLLFEMVGGEALGGGAKPAVIDAPKKEDNLAGLRFIYEAMEKTLRLAGQGTLIDYTAANFIHADLTMAEFEDLQKEKGESLIGLMLQVGINGEKPAREPDSLQLIRGMLTGNPDLVKLELMHTMADGDKQIGSLAGENVVISERNKKCMEVLGKQIAGGEKKIGIFYGAAHFPDMENRLEEMGFSKVSSKWLTAWRVAKH